MKSEKLSFSVSETIGVVRAELVIPEKTTAAMTLAHGAGADMNHNFMKALATALAARNIATLRFNFPYIERGKKIPDPPAIAEKTVAAAIGQLHERFPQQPLFISGKSFGGRMSSQHLAKHQYAFLKGIVFYGFPLHAPGKPSTDRAAHVADITIPLLFLQGTRDALAQHDLIRKVSENLPLASLVSFEGADHSFKAGKKVLIDELANETKAWMDTHS